MKRYSIESRCYGGKIPTGSIVDESSGSSGSPSNWVRSHGEREDLKHSIQRLSSSYGDQPDLWKGVRGKG